MFRRNEKHRQADMFGSGMQMSERRRRRLEASWADTFYREFFCRIDETVFADLYSSTPSRPNVPVNVLVAFEVLKAGHGWSDEEAYDAVCFDIQVRHALGMRDLYSDDFCLRTVYYFRRAVARHARLTGENLFATVFEQVTGEQMRVYEIRSRKLRMDSTQVASNIATMTRLELLATVLHRVHRTLDAEDRERWADELGPYVSVSSRKYAYRLRDEEPRAHLVRIGRLMARLATELKAKYGHTDAYGWLTRALDEHFVVVDDVVLQRLDEEISAQSLQSPDDPEATFRSKSGRGYRGYVTNVAETCDETNKVQLIVEVAVAPNSADDGQMLVEAIDSLVERTEVGALYTDGGYNGPDVDKVLTAHGVEQYQTGIRGAAARGVGRDAFDWELDEEATPLAVTCPCGQRVPIETGRHGHNLIARFDRTVCEECPLRDWCPTRRLKRRPQRVLRLTERDVHAARRVRRSREMHATERNPRAAVEATVWSMKAPLPRGRVPCRGHARVTMYAIATALMVNVRRLTGVAVDRPPTASETAPSLRRCLPGVMSRLLATIAGVLDPAAPASRSIRFAAAA